MTATGALLIVLSALGGVIGSYLFPHSIVPKLMGFLLMCFGFLLIGPHIQAMMKAKRQQVENYWNQHPGNPKNAPKAK